jgi:predicted HAD superfamily phosphohydrolase
VLETIARQHRATLEDVAFIGDSINDQAALAAVRSAGGLAIAFNATAHALPAATVAVAAPSLLWLVPLIAAWQQDGPQGARRSAQELSGKKEVHCDWLLGASGGILGSILAYHEAMRRRLRRAPADLS